MTKTKPNKHVAKKYPTSPRKNYTTFYLVMLIISTITLSFSVFSVFDLYNLAVYSSVAPVYTSLMTLSILTVPVSLYGLVLLYQKRKLGLKLTLAMLAVSFIIGIGLLFFVNQVIDYTLATTSKEEVETIGGTVFFNSFLLVFWTAGLIIGELFTIAMAVLWYFAWKNQHPAAKKQKQ